MRRLLRRIRRRLRGGPDAADRALRLQIERAGGSLQPIRPGEGWRRWRNRALRTHAEVDEAVAELRRLGLVPHQDAPKNWDHLVALGEILSRTDRDARVLEMGAASYSPLLVWLYQYGYRHLNGIDLGHGEPSLRGPIRLERMDLQHTRYPDSTFDAIACLSVIEHGVEVTAYLAEARRLLKPGGLLVTSTDYWADPIDTAGKVAYGVPVHLFTSSEIEALVETARDFGFDAHPAPDLACEERVVHWARLELDYTFVVLTLVANRPPRDTSATSATSNGLGVRP
ncbi:MAG TPA: methyltransferase domain-containing protein [Candidatus Limnocylindrales bacterium]|jgi:SAM-dependent methyltransferase